MDLGIKGRRALVLGASTGLGEACATALCREGAQVALCSRSAERLSAAAGRMGAGLTVTADLATPGAGALAVQKVLAAWGGLDILITNTGGPPKGTFPEVTAAQWQESFQGLWLSAVEAIQAALPAMRKGRWGRVMLVTSVSAREPLPALTISNGLRAGLTGLAKSLSLEVAPDGITVNCLLPGYTATERLKELGIPEDKIAAQVPARRLGRPEEFAALAAFLASEQAGYITGQAISVDGGFTKGH